MMLELQHNTASEAEKQFRMEVSRMNYQSVLQAISNIEITRENVHEDLLGPANELLSAMSKKKIEVKRPYLDVIYKIDDVFNALYNTLYETVEFKTAEKRRLIAQINAENARLEAEKKRKEEIQQRITQYIQKWSDIASNSTTMALLNKVESDINLAKGRPLEFKDLHEDFVQRCNSILPIIKERKAVVAELEKAAKQTQAASDANNEAEYVKSLEKQAEINKRLRETQEKVLESSFKALDFSENTVTESVTESIKPNRKQWKWRVDDIETLYKKNPEFVCLVPNEEEIREFLRVKKIELTRNSQEQFTLNGLVIYLDNIYK